jgi:hypothetical protein
MDTDKPRCGKKPKRGESQNVNPRRRLAAFAPLLLFFIRVPPGLSVVIFRLESELLFRNRLNLRLKNYGNT